MSMDLFIARTMKSKVSLVFRGSIYITESQVIVIFVMSKSILSFHLKLTVCSLLE